MSAGMQGPPDPQQMQGPPPVETPPPSRDAMLAAITRAVTQAATNSLAATDPREVREFLQGVLSGAQAIVALDPTLIAPQGVPADVLAASIPQQQASTDPTADPTAAPGGGS